MATKGRYYQLAFKNAEKDETFALNTQTVYVRIYDLTLEDDTTTEWEIINLQPGGDPFHTSTVDNSEDKFTGIKPTQATIKIISTNLINLLDFVNAPIPVGGVDVGDPRWYVEAYLNTYADENFIFKGFINLDDCYEAFMPEGNEIVLVANDGLAGLKNIALTDFNNRNPKGYSRIADFLAWALSKTGMSLKLNAIFNIREATLTTDHFFDVIYEHAKTFEDKIGTSINCFDVIEKLIGDMAFITQRNGQWWTVRIDELAGSNPLYKAVFDTDGALLSIDTGNDYNKDILKESAIFFSQEQTTFHPQRPYKYIKETFRFEYPQEIIDNFDFSRGDFINFNTGTGVAKYTVEDWSLFTQTLGGVLGEAYIQRKFEDINMTYEKERFLVIDGNSSNPTTNWLKSNPFPIGKLDKVDLSFDVRFGTDYSGSGDLFRMVALLFLQGDDGTTWVCGHTDPAATKDHWETMNTALPLYLLTGTAAIWTFQKRQDKQTEWANVTCSTPPAPTSGDLFLLLVNHQDPTIQRHFSNIRITYTPYINGDYSKYSAYYYKVSKDINYINKRENQVYVSDSPKKLFKGGFFKIASWVDIVTSQAAFVPPGVLGSTDNKIILVIPTGDVTSSFPIGYKFRVTGTSFNNRIFTTTDTEYTAGSTIIHVAEDIIVENTIPTATFQRPRFDLANQFFSWNDVNSPATTDIHPYGQIQAFDVWNQFRNGYMKFQATVQGLGGDTVDATGNLDYPSLIHRFNLLDSSDSTNDRVFMLLTFDIDWYLCEWKGTLVEVLNSVNGKNYSDTLETKYEQ